MSERRLKGFHLTRRKHLAKMARRRFPSRPIGWVGGRLYLLDTRSVVIMETIPKPGKPANGWSSAFPARMARFEKHPRFSCA